MSNKRRIRRKGQHRTEASQRIATGLACLDQAERHVRELGPFLLPGVEEEALEEIHRARSWTELAQSAERAGRDPSLLLTLALNPIITKEHQ